MLTFAPSIIISQPYIFFHRIIIINTGIITIGVSCFLTEIDCTFKQTFLKEFLAKKRDIIIHITSKNPLIVL